MVTAAAAACLVGLGAGSPTAHADDHSYLAAMDNRDWITRTFATQTLLIEGY